MNAEHLILKQWASICCWNISFPPVIASGTKRCPHTFSHIQADSRSSGSLQAYCAAISLWWLNNCKCVYFIVVVIILYSRLIWPWSYTVVYTMFIMDCLTCMTSWLPVICVPCQPHHGLGDCTCNSWRTSTGRLLQILERLCTACCPAFSEGDN